MSASVDHGKKGKEDLGVQGKVITFYSHKGGVGKTTNCYTIAALLSTRKSAKVLMIDLDAQCNLTQSFGGGQPLADINKISYREGVVGNLIFTERNTIQHHRYTSLYLVKGDENQSVCEEEFAFYVASTRTTATDPVVIRYITIIREAQKRFNYIVIDLPPAFNKFCRMILGLTNDWVISLLPDTFGLNTSLTLSQRWSGHPIDYHIVDSATEFNRKYEFEYLSPKKSKHIIINKCKRGKNGFTADVVDNINIVKSTPYNHIANGHISLHGELIPQVGGRVVYCLSDFMTANAFAHDLPVPYLLSEMTDTESDHRTAHRNNSENQLASKEELIRLANSL